METYYESHKSRKVSRKVAEGDCWWFCILCPEAHLSDPKSLPKKTRQIELLKTVGSRKVAEDLRKQMRNRSVFPDIPCLRIFEHRHIYIYIYIYHRPPYPGIRVRGFLCLWRFFEVFLNIPARHKRWGLENWFVGTNSARRIHPCTAEAPETMPMLKTAHFISPESISDLPRLVFSSWPWAAGNIRFFLELFSKKSTSHRPSGISSKSKKVTSSDPLLINFSKESSD